MKSKPKYKIAPGLWIILANEIIFLIAAISFWQVQVIENSDNFRFEFEKAGIALGLIPILILVFYLVSVWRKRALKKFGDFPLVSRLIPNLSMTRPALKFILFRNAYFLLVVALMAPQTRGAEKERERKVIDIAIAVDLSKSMMTEDFYPNRLERAKLAIKEFIDENRQNRIALIVFGGDAYPEGLLSTSYNEIKSRVSDLHPDLLPSQGTNLAAAIRKSISAIESEEGPGKAIILLSDGEDHSSGALEATRLAVKKDMVVHTIGIGSLEGKFIPVYEDGEKTNKFIEDSKGSPVVSKLDESLLSRIAEVGNGLYIRANNIDLGFDKIDEELKKMKKASIESAEFTSHDDHFQYPLGLALFFIILEFLISNKKNVWLQRFLAPLPEAKANS